MAKPFFSVLTVFLILSIFTTTFPSENLNVIAQTGSLPESLFAGTNQAQLSELRLKAFQQSGSTYQASEFSVDFSNVINVPVYSQFAVFTTDSCLSIIGANIKTASGNVVDLVKDNSNAFSLSGIPSGVYTLDVMAQKEGENGTYGGILVIGEATNQEIQKQVVKITMDVNTVFKKPTLVNDPCNYHGQDICDESGECDSERFDCWSDCSDGSIQTTGQCPGDDRPLSTIASDDQSDLPDCDGSYQDCETESGYVCEAGSSDHECEVSEEENESDLPDCDGSYQDCETESGYVCEAGSSDHSCETSEEDNVEGESSNGDENTQEESEGDSSGEGDSGGDDSGEGDSGGDDSGEGDSGGDDSGEGDSGGDDSGGDEN